MSGRLVGEVVDWLLSPAAQELNLSHAERVVLLVIAERANETTREMWRHRGDDQSLLERICAAAKLTKNGASSLFKRLAGRGLDVRIPVKVGRDGRPVYAFEGTSMRFRLPEFPASVALPESPCEDTTSPVNNPVDNQPGESSETTESPCPDTGSDARGRVPTPKRACPGTTLSPSNPSTTNPSTPMDPTYGAEEEDTQPVTATPPAQKLNLGFEPDYREARTILERLPDLGGTYLAAAREVLGDETPLAELVIYAGRLAKEAS